MYIPHIQYRFPTYSNCKIINKKLINSIKQNRKDQFK